MSSTIIASSLSTPISTAQPPMDKEEKEAVAALLQLWVPLKVIKIGKPVSKTVNSVKKRKTSPKPKCSPKPNQPPFPSGNQLGSRNRTDDMSMYNDFHQ